MALKCFLNVFRLLSHFSTDLEERKNFYAVVDTILEARMIGNFGKPSLTFYQAVKKYTEYLNLRDEHSKGGLSSSLCAQACLASALFRTLEQFFGDLGFLQKVVFYQWSRQTMSFYFAFFKSFSITCSLLVEAINYIRLRKTVTRMRLCRKGDKESLDVRDGELQVSRVLIIRCLCDMYVYYKWIPSYHPIPVAAYLCGFTSGLLGVWLVWKDQRHPQGHTP